MNTKAKPYPFARKAKHYATLSDESLQYCLREAREARDIVGGTWNPPAFDWYQDDVSTILAEIEKRAKRKQRAK